MITFIPYDTGDTLLIGGQSALGGAKEGNIGPMPTYSINREDSLTPDGTYLGSKYSISINGTALLSSYDKQDLKTKGDRQKNIQALTLTNLKLAKETKAFGNGKLEISAYGGMPNNIIFNDARLLTISLPEQTEDSSGTQYITYSFTFEANEDGSYSENTGSLAVEQPDWRLAEASESWSLEPNDQVVFSARDLVEGDLYRTFTLTHTLTAKGLRKYTDGALDSTDGHAWRQAAGWINDRLVATGGNNPDNAIPKDLTGNTDGITAQFHPFYANKDAVSTIQDLKSTAYKARNKVRSINSNIAAGTYSVTDTWTVSLDGIKATHEVEISIDTELNTEYITISAQGTVTGLSENDVDTNQSDKYDNALLEYKELLNNSSILGTRIGLLIQDVYDNFSEISTKSGTLVDSVASYSESHDKIAGTIQWTIGVNDSNATIDGAVVQKVSYSYENDEIGYHQIDRTSTTELISGFPIIFDSLTTPEKKIKIKVDLIMDSNNRTEKPDGTSAYDLNTVLWSSYGPQLTSETESWNPKTGQYTMDVEYIYV